MSLEVEEERIHASGREHKIDDESLPLYPRHVASNVCWKLVSLRWEKKQQSPNISEKHERDYLRSRNTTKRAL